MHARIQTQVVMYVLSVDVAESVAAMQAVIRELGEDRSMMVAEARRALAREESVIKNMKKTRKPRAINPERATNAHLPWLFSEGGK